MNIKSCGLALCLVVGLLSSAAARAVEAPWVTRSNDNASLLLQIVARYGPESARMIESGVSTARAFLDPMVNMGRITPEEVKSFLMDEVCMSEGMATQEMQRYVFRAPGQATSYFYGYQRLMATRQAAQLASRNNFNRLAFNDFVLAQGLLPPKLLRAAVMEEFVPAHRG